MAIRESELAVQGLVSLLRAGCPYLAPAPPPPELTREMWTGVLEAARANGVVGLLDQAIEGLERTDVPAEVAASLRDTLRSNALAAGMTYRELGRVLDHAAVLQAPVVVLKGAALAQTLYPDPGLRAFGDLDLLIRQGDAARLQARLESAGYAAGQEMADGFRRAFDAEMVFSSPDMKGVVLDLHWGLVSATYYRQRMDTAWFWKNTEARTLAGHTTYVLNPTGQLLQLGAHAGLHHQDRPRLIWLYDLALLLTRRGGEIDWAAADAYAHTAHLSRPLRWVLDQVHAWWGITLPPPALTLFQPPRFDPVERTVYALTTSPLTEARTLSDVLSTPGVRRKMLFGRQHLFPDAAYMRTRYQMQNDSMLPLYYVRRLVESAFKFMRSLWAAATR